MIRGGWLRWVGQANAISHTILGPAEASHQCSSEVPSLISTKSCGSDGEAFLASRAMWLWETRLTLTCDFAFPCSTNCSCTVFVRAHAKSLCVNSRVEKHPKDWMQACQRIDDKQALACACATPGGPVTIEPSQVLVVVVVGRHGQCSRCSCSRSGSGRTNLAIASC